MSITNGQIDGFVLAPIKRRIDFIVDCGFYGKFIQIFKMPAIHPIKKKQHNHPPSQEPMCFPVTGALGFYSTIFCPPFRMFAHVFLWAKSSMDWFAFLLHFGLPHFFGCMPYNAPASHSYAPIPRGNILARSLWPRWEAPPSRRMS